MGFFIAQITLCLCLSHTHTQWLCTTVGTSAMFAMIASLIRGEKFSALANSMKESRQAPGFLSLSPFSSSLRPWQRLTAAVWARRWKDLFFCSGSIWTGVLFARWHSDNGRGTTGGESGAVAGGRGRSERRLTLLWKTGEEEKGQEVKTVLTFADIRAPYDTGSP